MFLLTGSQQFALMQGVSESLAGRIAILDLLPLSTFEKPGRSLQDTLWFGGYPELVLNPALRDLWIPSYLETYVQRDVRQVRNVHDLRRFEQFLAHAAATHGQELRIAGLARDIGVSQPTMQSWIGVVEASYVTLSLSPWYRNYGKRLVRAPKLYFLDPALVCALTRLPSPEAALAGPLAGPLFEGWGVVEARKVFAARGKTPAWGFWRSNDGVEVDLVLEIGGRIVPVEFKLTSTPTVRQGEPMRKLASIIGSEADPGLLVCRVERETPIGRGVTAIPWHAWPGWLADRLG